MNDNRDYWDILLVIGTIYLGLLAAFQDFVKRLFYKPILDCELILEPPHCHLLSDTKTYYIRFKISNTGNISANNVEVFLKNISKVNSRSGSVSSGNLVWSTLKYEKIGNENPEFSYRMYWDFISPKTYQYCNLGEIKHPVSFVRDDLIINHNNLGYFYVLELALYWKSIDKSFILRPGKYIFEIIVAASNAKAITKTYKLDLTGKWYDNEADMFSEGIKFLE